MDTPVGAAAEPADADITLAANDAGDTDGEEDVVAGGMKSPQSQYKYRKST